MLTSSSRRRREYLLISDFDQTLSQNDSGVVLSEMLGISDFRQRVAGLSDIHLVQQGGELAYLLLHDPVSVCSQGAPDRGGETSSCEGKR